MTNAEIIGNNKSPSPIEWVLLSDVPHIGEVFEEQKYLSLEHAKEGLIYSLCMMC